MSQTIIHQEEFYHNLHESNIDMVSSTKNAHPKWQTEDLGNIVEVLDKQRKPLNELHRQNMRGSYPYCGANGIVDYVDDYLFDGEYILLAEDGGYWGSFEKSAYLMRGKFWVNNHAHILHAQQGITDSQFFVYMLNYLNIDQFIHGTTRGKLTQGVMLKIPIPLPAYSEQCAIAHVLQTVQDAIQARHKELELERERKAALMQHLFTHGTRGEPTKQTEIGEMPESWNLVNLRDLCANNMGLIQTGPFGSQLHASDYKEDGIPVVNPTHLGINTIIEDHLPLISQEDAGRLTKHYLLEGDILISRRGDFSRYAYITSRQARWLCGTGCLLVRLNNPRIDNYFLAISIGSENIQKYLSFNATGSIMPNLNTKILEGLLIVLPSIEEQHDIANLIYACDSKIAALEKEIALQEELFRALLDELMTGRLSILPLVE
jgi:type I restriction enzyme S subunit